jgi:hypothetical protein
VNSFKLALSSDIPIKSVVVKKASLGYKKVAAGDEWTGVLGVQLPAGPEVDGNVKVLNGSLAEVGVNVNNINKPIGEIVFLQSLGLDVTLVPNISAKGSIGLSAGPKLFGQTAATLDGSLQANIGSPFVLKASGTLTVAKQTIASASATATIPGGFSFSGDITRDFVIVKVSGHVGGSISAQTFSAEGGVSVTTPIASGTGDAYVNPVGIAGCGTVKVLWASLTIGGAYLWNNTTRVLQGSCGFSQLKGLLAARDAALGGAQQTISIPHGERQLNVIVRGSGQPPTVLLVDGTERALIKPNTEGELGHSPYLALADPSTGTTYIAIAAPTAGTLAVGPAPGAPALVSIGSSTPLPSPNVSVSLRRIGPARFRMAWHAASIPGQTLVFLDADARGRTQILRTRAARGSAVFTASEPGVALRHTLRVLVEQDGLVRQAVDVARFRIASVRLTKPRVTVSIKHGTAFVSWSAVRGATGYDVRIATADGRRLLFRTAPRTRSLTIPGGRGAVAQVGALGPEAQPGPFAIANG